MTRRVGQEIRRGAEGGGGVHYSQNLNPARVCAWDRGNRRTFHIRQPPVLNEETRWEGGGVQWRTSGRLGITPPP